MDRCSRGLFPHNKKLLSDLLHSWIGNHSRLVQRRTTEDSHVGKKKERNIIEIKIFKIVTALKRRWEAIETERTGDLGDTFHKH